MRTSTLTAAFALAAILSVPGSRCAAANPSAASVSSRSGGHLLGSNTTGADPNYFGLATMPRRGPTPQDANSDLVVNNFTAQPNPTYPTVNVGSSYTISYDQAWNDVYVGYGGGSGGVSQVSNTLTLSTVLLVGAGTGSTGGYDLNNVGTIFGGDLGIGDGGGTGTFKQTGGSLDTNGGLISVGSGAGSQGTFSLGGSSSVVKSGDMVVGQLSTGNSQTSVGTFNMSGGACQMSSRQIGDNYYGGGTLAVGNGAGSLGTVNLSGGTLVTFPTIGFFPPPTFIGNQGGTGIFNHTGGTFSSNFIVFVGAKGGTGIYTLSGTGVLDRTGILQITYQGGTGTFNLNGGTLSVGQVVGNSGQSTFHFNGGLLQAIRDDGAFVAGNLTTADVRNGGARIDSLSYNVEASANLLHSTVAGDNATDGGLSKLGTGTLTLSGTGNTYNGTTVVYAGTLLVSGSLTTSPFVSVASGATLTITGSVSTSYLINSGRVLLKGTLTLPAGGTFNNNGVLDLINYAGALPAGFSNSSNGKIIRASDVHITQITNNAGTVQVTVGAYGGHLYQLQASAALGSAANWTKVGNNQTTSTDASLTFSDTAPGTGAQRFYRVLIAPQ